MDRERISKYIGQFFPSCQEKAKKEYFLSTAVLAESPKTSLRKTEENKSFLKVMWWSWGGDDLFPSDTWLIVWA